MVIRNLTCKPQSLTVKEITGCHREYDINFQPQSAVELDRHLIVVHPEKYAGIFDLGVCIIEETRTVGATDAVGDENPTEEIIKDEIPVDETVKEETPIVEFADAVEDKAPDSFICDICGAEFASARGLASHKNKAHSE